MDDLDLRSSLLTLDKVQIILTLFSLNRSPHKLILSLFRFDVYLRYATVFHTLKLAEGGSATEAVVNNSVKAVSDCQHLLSLKQIFYFFAPFSKSTKSNSS